jgi:putative component of toxin-antitoxin plasmid stabilization module
MIKLHLERMENLMKWMVELKDRKSSVKLRQRLS